MIRSLRLILFHKFISESNTRIINKAFAGVNSKNDTDKPSNSIVMTRISIFSLCFLITLSAISANNVEKIFRALEPMSDSCLENLGQKYLSQNSCDTALVAFTILYGRFAKAETPEEMNSLGNAYNGIGIAWFMKADYHKAYVYFKKAESTKAPLQTVNALNNLASMYYYFRDYEKSHQYYDQAFRLARDISDWNRMSLAALNLMNLEFENSPDGNVSALYLNAIDNFKDRPDNPRTRFIQLSGSAMKAAGKGDFIQAEHLFKSSLALTDSLYMPLRHRYNVYINLAHTAFFAGDNEKERTFLEKAYSISEQGNFTELKIDILGKLADHFGRIGLKDLEKQYDYKKYALSDSSFTATEMKKMYDVDLEMETDKYEQKISLLDVEIKWRRKWMIALLIILLSTCAFIVFICRYNLLLKRKNRSLFKANQEIVEKMELEKRAAEYTRPVPDVKEIHKETEERSDSTKQDVDPILLSKILEIMEKTDIICRNDFSLTVLARLCESNTRYVSAAINDGLGMSFPNLLNRYRVNEARRMFLNPAYSQYTLEAIVERLGYKSRSSFSKTFKKVTGLSPAEFIKLAHEEKLSDIKV